MDNDRSLPVRVSPDNHSSDNDGSLGVITEARSAKISGHYHDAPDRTHWWSVGVAEEYLQLQLQESELVSDNGHHTNGSKCYPKPSYT